jgi:hypothetical protein
MWYGIWLQSKVFPAFRFLPGRLAGLGEGIRLHISQNEMAKTERFFFGTRNVVEGSLSAPDGRHPQIRSVWFVKNDGGSPVFVTAYPLKGEVK